MRTKAPDAFKVIYSGRAGLVTPATDTTFVRVSDATFEGPREMARGVKQIQWLE